ncbi:hypothetical protein [Gulosibacter sp. ACHW.36C]|uniref:Uncharacterized protein n=1 Tax=Gulosibacter sediminis TaxID=1729695 RepID=A0ABY4MYK5_9MICO|nr:hypothetical protein [Gulosibacter sediminis]UQN15109.1 hypothetical protein M3M28_01170 [Gulosibacter sediminis]
MSSFLIVYSRSSGEVHLRQFDGPNASREALEERFRLEAERQSRDTEIVVLNSDSEASIRRTHRRYFLREQAQSA